MDDAMHGCKAGNEPAAQKIKFSREQPQSSHKVRCGRAIQNEAAIFEECGNAARLPMDYNTARSYPRAGGTIHRATAGFFFPKK
eukprot:7517233-Karenia_brevis.AAC.1